MAQLAQVATQQRAIINVEGHQLTALCYNKHLAEAHTPVIFIHGIGGTINFWEAGQPFILENRFWASLSLPGHTSATYPDGFKAADITAEGMAAVMAEAVRKLTNGKPAVLVGHSTGGFMALNIAAHAPELVAGVLSMAGFAHGYWTGVFRIAQQMCRLGTLPGRLIFVYRDWLMRTTEGYEEYLTNLAADIPAMRASRMYRDTFDMVYADTISSDNDAVRLWFKQMPDVDITPQLANIQAPVLHLHGEQDPIVPPAQGPHIIAHVLNGELVTLPGCGHMLPWERNQDYQTALTRFLRSIVE